MSRPPSPATIFIRKHPTLPAAEVVALATKAGIATHTGQVNKVRDRDRERAKKQGKEPPPKVIRASAKAALARPAPAKPAPAKPAPAKPAPVKPAPVKAARAKPAPAKPAPAKPASTSAGSLESQLRSIALEMGLRNAEATLADIRAQVSRLL